MSVRNQGRSTRDAHGSGWAYIIPSWDIKKIYLFFLLNIVASGDMNTIRKQNTNLQAKSQLWDVEVLGESDPSTCFLYFD